MNDLEKGFLKEEENVQSNFANKWFQTIIQAEQYVGAVYSISYETALVQIHDHYRKKVGGIPSLSFLIATRIKPGEKKNNEIIDYTLEDNSIILLRVMDAAQLPNSDEAERIRVESAQRVSGETAKNWDDPTAMDARTNYLLSFAGVECRVIGTFFLDEDPNNSSRLIKCFGSDLSNYYPNQGLTVYKPNANALKEIVNYYQDTAHREDLRNHSRVVIGDVRYASTNRGFQEISNVKVSISPADLLEQKTALFGMTRTGKSNTTKIIAKSVFRLRFDPKIEKPPRIGQIIFDPNGEYANENVQDPNKEKNPSALKNVWQSNPSGKPADVVTYGILSHRNDPHRRLMKINFYDEDMLQTGKEIINGLFLNETSQYIKNFVQVEFEKPIQTESGSDSEAYSTMIRYRRRVLAYRALLKKAGFPVPPQLKPNLVKLFNKNLITLMQSVTLDSKDQDKEQAIITAAETLAKSTPSWDSLATAFEGLFYFLDTNQYKEFNKKYIQTSSTGESWADPDFVRILEMFTFTKGANQMGQVRNQHTEETNTDFAVDIYSELKDGKLVIIDQSSGDPEVNQSSAERIMKEIFRNNQQEFRKGKVPPDILIYIEEAHNLLPSGSNLDLENIWVRTAKEGAKYRLGMVYVTQEVSSIQKNILKNTANWFIGHLNNSDETRELCKFYDFADFEKSILRAQDRGFLRVKTLSNLFVVPVQIKKFEV